MASLHVHFLPDLVREEELAGCAVAVIDVLRATTTIVHALAAGAREVVPCLEVDDARAAAGRLPAGRAVLGGERQGLRIEGFDLGNSPTEYTPASVGGRTLVFTTTNGTRAMRRCGQAARVVLATFVNRSAVVEDLAREAAVHVVCAGTRGEITREDVLLAGALVERLEKFADGRRTLNDQASIARDAWSSALPPGASTDQLAIALHASAGGRNLEREGLAADIATAAQLDRFSLVPRLDVRSWTIRAISLSLDGRGSG
jgi:2-phosphosulfolactate phosphatase